MFMIVLYHQWKRLGGDRSYVAPATEARDDLMAAPAAVKSFA
jgi:hypothetical protein